jgi:mono/diheme cytochrome c family protein
VAPLPWTREDLVRYMQTGFSERHGVAAGPMAPVIEGLSHQSDEDIHAMATYLMSYRKPVADAGQAGDAQALVKEKTELAKLPVDAQGYRLYQGACMACHRADPSGVLAGSSFGVRPQLSLNTNLYSDSPTNAIHVVSTASRNRRGRSWAPCLRSATTSATIRSPRCSTPCAASTACSPGPA